MDKRPPARSFFEYLERPITGWSRILLVVLVVGMGISYLYPLWKIELRAPQYPEGLWLEVYSYQLDPGNDGQHLEEINLLNHYIGMRPITREELSDLDWLPFAFGLLMLLGLRVALIGNVRALVDLAVISLYVSLFSLGRFAYTLYSFGHELDPKAPIEMEPFTPAIFGTKKVANFTTTSLPQLGGWLVGAFVAGVILLTFWNLYVGRRAAVAAEKAAAEPEEAEQSTS